MIPVAQIVKALGVPSRGLTITTTPGGYTATHLTVSGSATFDKSGKLTSATGQLKGQK